MDNKQCLYIYIMCIISYIIIIVIEDKRKQPFTYVIWNEYKLTFEHSWEEKKNNKREKKGETVNETQEGKSQQF